MSYNQSFVKCVRASMNGIAAGSKNEPIDNKLVHIISFYMCIIPVCCFPPLTV